MGSTETRIKNWLPTIVAVIALAANLVVVGAVYGDFKSRLIAVEDHATSATVHMPYEEKIKQFPTRPEFDTLVQAILREDDKDNARMQRIEDKLEKIYEIIMDRRE